ncbi:MAG TPA: MATE family efflux transporter [Burkholderiales bacterium]|nr:MATE family efflux transporter [Burkholderiales bacterium]
MDTSVAAPLPRPLPALRHDAHGRHRIDYRAVFALAAPLFLNSGIQAVLNLTDTWFIGHISTAATAGVGAVYWFVIVFILVFGGVSMAVQSLVAQAYGAGARHEAAQITWSGLWASILLAPLFLGVALLGRPLLAVFDLAPEIHAAALQFWFPRMLSAVAGVSLWTVTSFFNGIGRTRVTLLVMVVVSTSNALLNQLFIFQFGMGVAGAGWATGAAQLIGVAVAIALFLSRGVRIEYRSDRDWQPTIARLRRVFALGLPMGLLPAVDLTGLALFQMMLARLGAASGAATQIVMMLTSIAYMPAVGLASAGTTLVGQSIGAGNLDWANKVGNAAIRINVGYMGLVSLFLASSGHWLVPLFVSPTDPNAQAVIQMSLVLLWIGAAYQIFDGFNLGAGFCLRGAGDVRVPTLLAIALSWFGFVPLVHMLSFAPGQGIVHFLPQFGFGAAGGWSALLLYTAAIGGAMFLRWRSGAWRRIRLR